MTLMFVFFKAKGTKDSPCPHLHYFSVISKDELIHSLTRGLKKSFQPSAGNETQVKQGHSSAIFSVWDGDVLAVLVPSWDAWSSSGALWSLCLDQAPRGSSCIAPWAGLGWNEHPCTEDKQTSAPAWASVVLQKLGLRRLALQLHLLATALFWP